MNLREAAEALVVAYPYAGSDPRAVAAMLEDCPERTLGSGEVLCREKSHGDEAWVLVSGEVEVLKQDRAGVEHRLAVLSAPNLLGHLSLIDAAARSATLRAMGPATVRCLSRAGWVKLSNAATLPGSALRRLLLSALYQQLSQAHAQLQAASAEDRDAVMNGPELSIED